MTLWLRTADGIVPVGGAFQTVTPWTPATYENSWTNYGGSYLGAEYRRVGDMVQLRGLIASGTLNSTAFTLPTGFRPPAPMIFDAATKGTVYTSSRLSITTAGAVSVSSVEYTGGTGNHNSWVSLDGIEFSLTATGQAPDYTQAPNGLWTNFTPTWTNYTRGDGSVVAKFRYVGNSLELWVDETIGSTTVIGTDPELDIPDAATVDPDFTVHDVGPVYMRRTGIQTYAGTALWVNSLNAIRIRPHGASVTWVTSGTGLSSTIPFTWGSGDGIRLWATLPVVR
jgi:hypothetical protein